MVLRTHADETATGQVQNEVSLLRQLVLGTGEEQPRRDGPGVRRILRPGKEELADGTQTGSIEVGRRSDIWVGCFLPGNTEHLDCANGTELTKLQRVRMRKDSDVDARTFSSASWA